MSIKFVQCKHHRYCCNWPLLIIPIVFLQEVSTLTRYNKYYSIVLLKRIYKSHNPIHLHRVPSFVNTCVTTAL